MTLLQLKQILLVERYTGKPSEPIIKKKFFPHITDLKITTIRKYFL